MFRQARRSYPTNPCGSPSYNYGRNLRSDARGARTGVNSTYTTIKKLDNLDESLHRGEHGQDAEDRWLNLIHAIDILTKERKNETIMEVTLSAKALAPANPLTHGEQFAFKCTSILANGRSDTMKALTNSGATSLFISCYYVRSKKLATIPLKKPVRLRLGDGVTYQEITHIASLQIIHGDHYSEELAYVIEMKGYDLILGTPWLRTHNPHIN